MYKKKIKQYLSVLSETHLIFFLFNYTENVSASPLRGRGGVSMIRVTASTTCRRLRYAGHVGVSVTLDMSASPLCGRGGVSMIRVTASTTRRRLRYTDADYI